MNNRALVILILLFISIAVGCCTVNMMKEHEEVEQIQCKHIVLSQYATYKELGYECELWHTYDMRENNVLKHVVLLRVRRDKSTPWVWVDQPTINLTTKENQPKDTILREKIDVYDIILKVEK